MTTEILTAQDAQAVTKAADYLTAGQLVALPTETVYGLGANGLDPQAVAKIFAAKGRPQDNPLILHVADALDMEKFCHSIPKSAYDLAAAFWPGPLTMVLPAKDVVPKCTTAGLPTVAVRCPDCEITRQIIRMAGVPVAAPSANISGKPSTTTADHVYHDHAGKIPLIIDGGACRVGVESTIVDLTEDRPRLLRPGGITPEQLLQVLGDLVVDKAVTAQIDKDEVVKAPGMKYKHYAPQCQVLIIAGSSKAAAAYIHRHFAPGDRVLCFAEELPLYEGCDPLPYGSERDVATLSAGLFAALRELDKPGIGTVFARCPTGGGIAYAVQNRLKKAAGFQIIDAEAKENTVIGITGGTGCGKTTLLNVIREHGGTVLDCDAIYHDMLKTDKALLNAIEVRFPGVVENGSLQRKKLGAIVFADPAELEALNAITHSAIKQKVLSLMVEAPGLVAIDAIGLFEGKLSELCSVTVAVIADPEVRAKRLMARDGITEEYAKNRISAQHDNAWFQKMCDYSLENNESSELFHAKCIAFLQTLDIIKAE